MEASSGLGAAIFGAVSSGLKIWGWVGGQSAPRLSSHTPSCVFRCVLLAMPGKKKGGKGKKKGDGGDKKLPPPPNLDSTKDGAQEALLKFR